MPPSVGGSFLLTGDALPSVQLKASSSDMPPSTRRSAAPRRVPRRADARAAAAPPSLARFTEPETAIAVAPSTQPARSACQNQHEQLTG